MMDQRIGRKTSFMGAPLDEDNGHWKPTESLSYFLDIRQFTHCGLRWFFILQGRVLPPSPSTMSPNPF